MPGSATWQIDAASVRNDQTGATFQSCFGVIGKAMRVEWRLTWSEPSGSVRSAELTSEDGTKIVSPELHEPVSFVRPWSVPWRDPDD